MSQQKRTPTILITSIYLLVMYAPSLLCSIFILLMIVFCIVMPTNVAGIKQFLLYIALADIVCIGYCYLGVKIALGLLKCQKWARVSSIYFFSFIILSNSVIVYLASQSISYFTFQFTFQFVFELVIVNFFPIVGLYTMIFDKKAKKCFR